MIPAIAGVEAEVPPTRNTYTSGPAPAAHSPSTAQMAYALKFAPLEAKSETSGMSRALSAGTPGPVCQLGFGYPTHCCDGAGWPQLLGPPPPAPISLRSRPSEITSSPNGSFHTCSGSGAFKDPRLASFV